MKKQHYNIGLRSPMEHEKEVEECFYWKRGRCEILKSPCEKKRLGDCHIAEWYE